MNALVETLRLSSTSAEMSLAPELVVRGKAATAPWDPAAFAREQLCSLVRRVFFPGWPRPAKQVVFAAVEAEFDIAHICQKVGETLAAQVPGTICLVDADSRSSRMEAAYGEFQLPPTRTEATKHSKDRTTQLSEHLWFLRVASFITAGEKEFSAAWLRHRLSDLRREFDYTIIHAPAVGAFSETGLLAHLADGVVLVLNAERTRRIAAQHARDVLRAADARLIGAVLDQKRFPIPEAVYRRI
jgi:Mrp family chromosome partitioning ATPase